MNTPHLTSRPIQSQALEALIEQIRVGDPAAIAPEVDGLDKLLGKQPAIVVIELIGTTLNELADGFTTPNKLQPMVGELFDAWMSRMVDEVGSLDLSGDRYSETAYAAIGYDWVDWKWLPKGQNTHTMDRQEIRLPEVAQRAILSHPLLEHQKGAKATYSTLFSDEGNGKATCGTVRV